MKALKNLFLLPFLLVSCAGDESRNLFQQESFSGLEFFSKFEAHVDSKDKKITLSYEDASFGPASIEKTNSYHNEKVEKTWIGTSTKYERYWYLFDLLLPEEESEKVSAIFQKRIDQELDKLIKRGGSQETISYFSTYHAVGAAVGELQYRIDGKLDSSHFYVYAKMNDGCYYNGNSLFRIAPESQY